MEKERITVKDLKKWLSDLDEDAEVFIDTYDSNHHKEFISVHEYSESGKRTDKELLVVSELVGGAKE